jgi:hypothetical protein
MALVGKIVRTSIILPLVCLLAGCATGPNAHVRDAATLVANTQPQVRIRVATIDGTDAPDASIYYLAPGPHHLSITLWGLSHWESTEAEIIVGANKHYRIDAKVRGPDSFTAQIIDITSGAVVSSMPVTLEGSVVTRPDNPAIRVVY